MKREAIKDLERWKNKPNRKPLMLQGARQVGKTWLLKEFGENHYENCAYVNCEGQDEVRQIFEGDFDVEKMLADLSLLSKVNIEPGKTLVILDEVQEVPRAVTALKYFYENAPEYHIAVAGSLLGVAMHEKVSFPVGKVEFLEIHPLCFTEFLRAVREDGLAERIKMREFESLAPFHDKLLRYLKTYMVTGGMPEVVRDFVENGNLLNTRALQEQINMAYDRDFSKYADKTTVQKIREIFRIIPTELARENKRFIFKLIRESARSREYEAALLWLVDAGIAKRVECVNEARLPLSAYANKDIFKLFMVDVGLLGALAGLAPEVVLNGDQLFTEFKGALAEQFVLQEMLAQGVRPYYYGESDARREVDFIFDAYGEVVPVEVKSGRNLSSPSLNSLLEKNSGIRRVVKFSLLPYQKNEVVDNLPLYLAGASYE